MRSARRGLALAGLVGAVVVLHRCGRGPLEAPPVTSADGLGRWLAERDGAEAAMALVRVATMGLASYLAGASALAMIGGLRADAIVLPALRGIVHGIAGVTLTAAPATVVVGGGTGHAMTSDAPPTLPAVDPGSDGTATLRRLDSAVPPAPAAEPVVLSDDWLIQRGESFWAVAELHLAEVRGRAVTDAEVDPYWRTLVAANRDRLIDPSNADLLLPGQVIVLPPA